MVAGGRDIAVATSELMKQYDVAIWAHRGMFAAGEDFDLRWTSGKPLIVTTNLDLANLKNINEQELMFARISDRILDMCRPIHMQTVESKRVASGRHKNDILKEIFRKGGIAYGRLKDKSERSSLAKVFS